MQSSANAKREIYLFLVLTFALSAIFYYFIISAGSMEAGGGVYVRWLIWCPGIAALSTRLLLHKNIRGFGWGWGKSRYQLIAYFLPIGYGFFAYGFIWLSGLGGIKDDFSRNYGLFVVVGTLMSSILALGEEIGWRGLLVAKLYEVTSFTKTALISGVIWAFWHYPVLIFADYNAGTPTWYRLTCFTVLALCASFVLAWLRLKSGSVWTAVLFHASHNLYIQSFFDPLTTDTGITAYIKGEFGAALVITGLILAFIVWRNNKRSPIEVAR